VILTQVIGHSLAQQDYHLSESSSKSPSWESPAFTKSVSPARPAVAISLSALLTLSTELSIFFATFFGSRFTSQLSHHSRVMFLTL